MKKVHIIILNWNGWQDTIDLLNSLQKATYPNFNVVLIDNASTDQSVQELSQWIKASGIPANEYTISSQGEKPLLVKEETPKAEGFGRIEFIRSGINLGFCVGNNVGLDLAYRQGADYLLILNNDTIVEPDFLEPMVEAAETTGNVGLVGGLICYADEPDVVWWAGGKFDKYLETKRYLNLEKTDKVAMNEIYETEWISGCMTMVPRDIYEKLGGYYEGFFIWSEEWDLSLRVKKASYKLIVAPKSRIYHKVGKSLGVLKPLSYYYGTRNRLILKKLHLNKLTRSLYMAWFIPVRILRFTQFALQKRFDLVNAGYCAVKDYLLGREGQWDQHAK